jgi:hypothetical protein
MTVARSVDDVERLTHDPTVGAGAFTALAAPAVAGTQRVSALPFDPTRTQALLAALVRRRLPVEPQ